MGSILLVFLSGEQIYPVCELFIILLFCIAVVNKKCGGFLSFSCRFF